MSQNSSFAGIPGLRRVQEWDDLVRGMSEPSLIGGGVPISASPVTGVVGRIIKCFRTSNIIGAFWYHRRHFMQTLALKHSHSSVLMVL